MRWFLPSGDQFFRTNSQVETEGFYLILDDEIDEIKSKAHVKCKDNFCMLVGFKDSAF